MTDPTEIFLRLVAALASPSTLPNGWDQPDDTDKRRTEILKAIYRLPLRDAHVFLATIHAGSSPNETAAELLNRAHKMACTLLPEMLRRHKAELEAEAATTHKDRFLKNESQFDPFLEDANLTTDSYSGRGEMEADPPTVLDRWGNVLR